MLKVSSSRDRFFLAENSTIPLRIGRKIVSFQRVGTFGGATRGVYRTNDPEVISALQGWGRGVSEISPERFHSLQAALEPPAPIEPVSKTPIGGKVAFVQLARTGDIVNILPLVRQIARSWGTRPDVFVHKDFASLFDGVTYANAVPLDCRYGEVLRVANSIRTKYKSVILSQVDREVTPVQPSCSNYNIESWKLSGFEDAFYDRSIPLVFDRRNGFREAQAVNGLRRTDKPMLLLHLRAGISSKFGGAEELQNHIYNRWSAVFEIIDLANVTFERFYDMLGFMDSAALLICSDTAPLHLAAASCVPVIAMLSDRGQYLQTKPRYDPWLQMPGGQWRDRLGDIDAHIERALCLAVSGPVCIGYEFHESQEPRAWEAQKSWPETWLKAAYGLYNRSATGIGDKRELPYLRDILGMALQRSAVLGRAPIIIYANGDIWFGRDANAAIHRKLWQSPAISAHRCEGENGPAMAAMEVSHVAGNFRQHVGRDVFAFKSDWLRSHLDQIPDFIIGAPHWDMCLANLIRNLHGRAVPEIPMWSVVPECELELGHVIHQDHPAKWTFAEYANGPANMHNLRLAREWHVQYTTGWMPEQLLTGTH